jgi:hypothetical protein
MTIVGVKMRHDYNWGCDNLLKVCLGLSQPSVITPFIVMPNFNPNNCQIYLGFFWGLDSVHINFTV